MDDAQSGDDGGDGATASISQLSTIVNKCATGATENADGAIANVNGGDSYTRSATVIDSDCGCSGWQADMNVNGAAQANLDFPSCRPWTYFDVDVTAFGNEGDVLDAEVADWGTGTSQTECENSELDVAILKSVNGDWQAVWPTTLHHYFIFHPTFNTNTHACESLEKGQFITSFGAGTYRIESRAIRGLDANNHGYAGVSLNALSDNLR